MSAPMKFDLETATPLGKDGPAPAELAITVRDRRFCRDDTPPRWWHGGDPVATAWHNALSVAFPRGEALFVEAVKAFRDGAHPKLEAEIRAFVKQEVNHTREHVAFNRVVTDTGYDIANLDRRVSAKMDLARKRSPIANLAATAALEHFTAVLAHVNLSDPAHLAGADRCAAELWRWHSIEEIEHKGVAYDTYRHATRDWSAFRRWRLLATMAVLATHSFVADRIEDALELLAQDGLTGRKWKRRLLAYIFWRPGILRQMAPGWVRIFLPGFHPWKQDDRALIGKHDSAYPDAVFTA